MSCKAIRGQPAPHTCTGKVQVEEKDGDILQGAEAGDGGDKAGGDRACASRDNGENGTGYAFMLSVLACSLLRGSLLPPTTSLERPTEGFSA